MDGYIILFAILKIVVVLLFLINTAAILTWGERRQCAMIQDRVGPNRAVVFLPGIVFKVLPLVVGLGLAAATAGYAYQASLRSPQVRLDAGFGLTELAVLLLWFGVIAARRQARLAGQTNGLGGALAGISDGRVVFYLGLAGHVAVLLARSSIGDGEPGGLAPLFFFVGPAIAVGMFLLGGVSGFLNGPTGKVGLRLGGTLHAAADGVKLAFKEDFIPTNADRLLHSLGPIVALFPILVVFAVIPFGDTMCVHIENTGHFLGDLFNARIGQVVGHGYSPVVPRHGMCTEGAVPFQIANLNVGILFMFAMAGTGIIGAAIAGWSSDNKFSLMGGLRASSQMVSYEVAMGLSLVGAFMVYGSVRLDDMVRWQGENAWGIFVQPFAFFLFLATAIAENKRTPFDAPEGESEIVAGYFLEYSGFKFSMFMLGEYMELAISSAVLTTVFFGGYSLPFLHRDGLTIAIGDSVYAQVKMAHASVVIIGMLAFFIKTWLVAWAQIFIRWTIPRFRYDQIMKLGWRFLLPSAIANMLLTGIVLLAIDQGGAELAGGLHVLANLSQALVFVSAIGGVIWLISGILAPERKFSRAVSSSATFAERQGGTKASPMQA